MSRNKLIFFMGSALLLISTFFLFGGSFSNILLETGSLISPAGAPTPLLVLPVSGVPGGNAQVLANPTWIFSFRETDNLNTAGSYGQLNLYAVTNDTPVLITSWALPNLADNLSFSVDISSYVSGDNQTKIRLEATNSVLSILDNISITSDGKPAQFSNWTISTTGSGEGQAFGNSRIMLRGNGDSASATTQPLKRAPFVSVNPSGIILSPEVPNISIGQSISVNVTVSNLGFGTAENVTLDVYTNDILSFSSPPFSLNESQNRTEAFSFTVAQLPTKIDARIHGADIAPDRSHAVRWISKRKPYFFFSNISSTGLVKYKTEAPYASWYSKVIADANSALGIDFTSQPDNYRCVYGRDLAAAYQLTGNITYANKGVAALLNYTGSWGSLLIHCGIAYNWLSPYIIENTSYNDQIQDKLALAGQSLYRDYLSRFYYGPGWAGETRYRIGDPDTGPVILESALGIVSLAVLDYHGQYQDESNPQTWLDFMVQDTFNNTQVGVRDYDPSGEPWYRLKVLSTPGGLNCEGAYRDYDAIHTTLFVSMYKDTFDDNLIDQYPRLRAWLNWPLWYILPTGEPVNKNTAWAELRGEEWINPHIFSGDEAAYHQWYINSVLLGNTGLQTATDSYSMKEHYFVYDKYAAANVPSWNVTGASNSVKGDPSFIVPSADMAVMRSGYANDSLVLALGGYDNPCGASYGIAHKDLGTYEISGKGAWLGGDAGDTRYFIVNNATAHNKIMIDGKDLCKGDRFRFDNSKDKVRIIQPLATDYLDFAETASQIDYLFTTECAPANEANWTRSVIFPNNEYFVVMDKVQSANSRPIDMYLLYSSDTVVNPIPGLTRTDNHAEGNLSIGGSRVAWWGGAWDGNTGSNTSAMDYELTYPNVNNITWTTVSRTLPPTSSKKVELLTYLVPAANITNTLAPTHKGVNSGDYSFWTPYLRARQDSSNAMFLTIHYPRNSTDSAPTISTIQGIAGGYGARLSYGIVTDLMFVSDAPNSTADSLASDAKIAYSRYNSGLHNFFMRNGSWLSYNGQQKVSLSTKVPVFALEYTGGNVSFTLDGSGTVDISIYGMNPTGTYYVLRDGMLYTNWSLNGAVMQISTSLSAHKFDISDSAPSLADLQVLPGDIILSTPSPAKNVPLNVSATISNLGSRDAEGVQVVLLENGQQVASGSVSVSPGNSSSITLLWTPSVTGQADLSVSVDPSNYVSEYSKSDNLATIQVSVSQAPPDLAFSSSGIVISPDAPDVGRLVMVNATLENIGGTNASNFTVQFLVDLVPVSTFALPLAANSSSDVYFIWTAVAGTHTLAMSADSLNGIFESNELNNDISRIVSVSAVAPPPPPPAPPASGGGGGGGGGGFTAPVAVKAQASEPIITVDLVDGSIEVAPGNVSYLKFYVWNMGSTDLYNVSTFATGLNASWVTVPPIIAHLPVNSPQLVTVILAPPAGTSGVFYLSLGASLSNVSQHRTVTVSVAVPPETAASSRYPVTSVEHLYTQAAGAISQEIDKSLAVQDATGTRKYVPVAAGALVITGLLLLAKPELARRLKAAVEAPQNQ